MVNQVSGVEKARKQEKIKKCKHFFKKVGKTRKNRKKQAKKIVKPQNKIEEEAIKWGEKSTNGDEVFSFFAGIYTKQKS